MSDDAAGGADWYRCEVDRATLRALSRRTDRDGILHFGGYFLLLGAFGAALAATWGTLLAWPVFFAYAALWSFGNATGHEACHGTPFRSQRLNTVLLYVSAWMENWEPITVRWVHARHHTHTSEPDDDAEYLLPNPVRVRDLLGLLTGWNQVWHYNVELVQLSCGHANPVIRRCVPASELPKVFRNARLYLASYLAIIGTSVATASWLPVCLLVLPRVVGAPVHGVLRILQHGALATGVRDHRLNTRSMRVSAPLGWLYCNMQYHLEHHMFPMVPFHALPALHAQIGDQLPPPTDGVPGGLREVFTVWRRQRTEPGFVLPRTLPDTP